MEVFSAAGSDGNPIQVVRRGNRWSADSTVKVAVGRFVNRHSSQNADTQPRPNIGLDDIGITRGKGNSRRQSLPR